MLVKITSGIAIGGKIIKAGSQVEVDDKLGADLLRRGKAEAVKTSTSKAAADADGKTAKDA